MTIVNAPDDAVVLRPPPPGEAIADVGAAVRDALRFPLSGDAIERLVRPGGYATIVAEPPALPIPGSATADPRQSAIAAVADELARLGVPSERQTIVVACGLGRRVSPREIGGLVSPEFRRRFRGRVIVHDAEDPDLVELGWAGNVPLKVNPALVETDLVVVVSAAETVLHGGPAALLGASGTKALRAAGAFSLLETSGSQGWRTALALEVALTKRVPVTSASLVLNHPRLGGALRGYPFSADAGERISGSQLRRAFGLLPAGIRRLLMTSVSRELSAAAVFGGPPSVAHAEALIRAIEFRSASLDRPLDAICIGIPPVTPYLPRERPNPVSVSYLGLGLALRLWRNSFPVADGGTAILLHGFNRRFAHPTQQPYRALFGSRHGRDPEAIAAAEAAAAVDPRGIDAYRRGRACHPLLPFVEWDACEPALGRLGAVLVAGCRDATAARQFGFVPTQSIGAALTMARGLAGDGARIGFLLSPPYFPITVG